MSLEDFVFAWEGEPSYGRLRVVRFAGEEAMSQLFRYEIHLLSPDAGEDPSPDDLIGKRATLRIETQSMPAFKVIHGVITEAEDATFVAEGTVLRVVLEPPLARSRYRVRSRIFLDKTLRQIVETVLRTDAKMKLAGGSMLEPPQGNASYRPAEEQFTWRISSAARLDNPKARPYVVQYNESDLDFVARLLEEEGMSYHVEHSDDVSLLVISDADAGRPRVADNDVLGPGLVGRHILHFRLGGRLRSGAVRLGEYNWKKPALSVDASAKDDKQADLEAYAFPGAYLESSEQGLPLAQARLDRLHSEATFATGDGTVRVLSAGMIFTLEHPKPRYDGQYLVTRLRATGHQEGVLSQPVGGAKEPFSVEIECACRGRGKQIEESRFRPEQRTKKPRIVGTQTAFVTAEPAASGAEVNIGGPSSIGCVRVRFHWDTEAARLAKEPSSLWVRVSQPFARGGQGGIWHPRVGCEVIIEFEEGDPDRPLVTGRVYNGKNRPPRTAPTHSTLHSLATPGGAVRNEISFEDTAGSERIYTNAGKDMTANVGNNRVENVGANALMTVGADNLEQIGANQSVSVGANDSLNVGGDQAETIGANQTRVVGANRTIMVGANETRLTAANHTNMVGGSLSESVGANVTEAYGATRTTTISASFTESYGATRDQTVSALAFQSYGGNQTTNVSGARTIQSGGMLGVLVGGDVTTTVGGSETVTVGGTAVHVAGGPITHTAPDLDVHMSLKLELTGIKLSMAMLKATATGYSSSMSGVSLSAKGFSITATGLSKKKWAFKGKAFGAEGKTDAAQMKIIGVLINPAGLHIVS